MLNLAKNEIVYSTFSIIDLPDAVFSSKKKLEKDDELSFDHLIMLKFHSLIDNLDSFSNIKLQFLNQLPSLLIFYRYLNIRSNRLNSSDNHSERDNITKIVS